MRQQPELDLSEIVASVIATTLASGLMATAGLAEATAQVPDSADADITPEPDRKPSEEPAPHIDHIAKRAMSPFE